MTRFDRCRCRFVAGAVAVVLAAVPCAARAEPSTGETDAAKRTAVGEAYLKSVEGRRLQTPIVYLSPDSDLGAAKPGDRGPDPLSDTPPHTLEWGGTGVLVVLALALALFLWLARGQLADLAGPRNRGFGSDAARGEAFADAELDRDLIAGLRRENDPRKGLRMVLERFLRLAAEDNAIVLKRSLTTRELMQRLPGSWAHRRQLEVLARQTELVLFGGRDIGAADYQRCLDLAEPFLKRTAT
ncbi:DUF4129 domain-containing protein [Jiella sonneratiae]|uniref:DUF4129 domain-containing protein n=1 Tax=Jiella sonneratiae TaxID=2816856 RepID=A0ABS3J8N3_9HYPH|nr:DUF4129 domain-containing protein [Jiella sonneratiae]MBO0905500.1 DUF4129 domain-containing protein [Jiella sonneratiae]